MSPWFESKGAINWLAGSIKGYGRKPQPMTIVVPLSVGPEYPETRAFVQLNCILVTASFSSFSLPVDPLLICSAYLFFLL